MTAVFLCDRIPHKDDNFALQIARTAKGTLLNVTESCDECATHTLLYDKVVVAFFSSFMGRREKVEKE